MKKYVRIKYIIVLEILVSFGITEKGNRTLRISNKKENMNWGKYGKQNVVTNKDITINKISEQTRKIKFRDNMNLDIGLRFAEIVDEILMTADDFITAITNAINTEQ